MGLLYNVTAFMRPGQPITVKVSDPNRSGAEHSPWKLTIKIGPGGEDTIDIHTDIENAARLRDALTEALEALSAPAEPKVYRCACCTYPAYSAAPISGHTY